MLICNYYLKSYQLGLFNPCKDGIDFLKWFLSLKSDVFNNTLLSTFDVAHLTLSSYWPGLLILHVSWQIPFF